MASHDIDYDINYRTVTLSFLTRKIWNCAKKRFDEKSGIVLKSGLMKNPKVKKQLYLDISLCRALEINLDRAPGNKISKISENGELISLSPS